LTPGLLVSVRNAAEAIAALAGGAEVIDVKEPSRGPLGAADHATMADVALTVNGRALVTAAVGELFDLIADRAVSQRSDVPEGFSLFKIGLAGCRDLPNWQGHWHQMVETMSQFNAEARPVAVAYADWRAARSPDPNDVLSIALDYACPALLIDTWDKSAGTLFDAWRETSLHKFVQLVRSHDLTVVLAGSLSDATFERAVTLGADFVAVRSAACDGGRNGTVSAERVRALKRLTLVALRSASSPLTREPGGAVTSQRAHS
jgi:uncharacterized protein (UPF0264 family)